MSSANCARAHSTPADREALIAAVAAVAENSFFAFAEPWPADVPWDATRDGWYEARVAFRGPFDGRVTVSLPCGLARALLSSFLGCEEGQMADEEALHDLVGEFANMACGAWLTSLGERACFDLERPDVRSSAAPRLDGTLLLSINDQPMTLHLDTETSAS